MRTVHARGDGDDTIVAEAKAASEGGAKVAVVTADRVLQARVARWTGTALSPSWLLDRL